MAIYILSMEGLACKVTEVAFLHSSTNIEIWLHLCVLDIFSSVFASPFTDLLHCFYSVFDSVKIAQ